MPGSVANAAPSTVLPFFDGMRILRQRQWLTRINEYRDGRGQRLSDFATSRKAMSVTMRLTGANMDTLFAFYAARNGPHEPFIVYDMIERGEEGLTPLYDPTGVATGAGKYTVIFVGPWSQAVQVARGMVTIPVLEVT